MAHRLARNRVREVDVAEVLDVRLEEVAVGRYLEEGIEVIERQEDPAEGLVGTLHLRLGLLEDVPSVVS